MKKFFQKFGKFASDWFENQKQSFRRKIYRQSGGELQPVDKIDYELAIEREQKGEVQPLPKNATSPFG